MKTADLIPLILHELNNGDKYGFELTKEIEDRSNQQIQIKQPTLYTVLKKLEKSKFITSYWQDSEIGGKRHYYKITDNGKAQLLTLPSFDESLNAILLDDSQNEEENEASNETIAGIKPSFDKQSAKTEQNPNIYEPEHLNKNIWENLNTNNEANEQTNTAHEDVNAVCDDSFINNHKFTSQNEISQSKKKDDDNFSIMDLIADNASSSAPTAETKISVINSNEVFKDDIIDHKTQIEQNKENVAILKETSKASDEVFAENKDISKFTEKTPPLPADTKPTSFAEAQNGVKTLDNLDKANLNLTNADYAFNDIKYVDYVDFKTKKSYIKAKKVAKFSLIKTFLTSTYLLAMILLCCTVVLRTQKASILFYIMLPLSVVGLGFYMGHNIHSNQTLRLKALKTEYKLNLKLRLIINSTLLLAVIVVSIISSIFTGFNTISSMFGSSNFANIYAPVLLTSSIFIDLLIAHLFKKVIDKI